MTPRRAALVAAADQDVRLPAAAPPADAEAVMVTAADSPFARHLAVLAAADTRPTDRVRRYLGGVDPLARAVAVQRLAVPVADHARLLCPLIGDVCAAPGCAWWTATGPGEGYCARVEADRARAVKRRRA